MTNKKVVSVAAVTVGTILAGGLACAYCYRSKPETSDTDGIADFSKIQPQPAAECPATSAQKSAHPSSSAPHAPAKNVSAAVAPAAIAQQEEGVHVYDSMGLIMKLAPTWKIAEDVSPLPNVAMITIQNTQYQYDTESMPGKVPVLILSVEDVSLEKLDVFEFKEKSKAIAMRQMYAMTNGMVPPNIIFDGPEVNGRFQMKLQYSMICPLLQLQVVNYIAVEHELAYVLQFMATPEVFQMHEADIITMVKNIQITKIPTYPNSFTEISNKTSGVVTSIPVSWVVLENTPLTFETPSPTKPDRIELLQSKAFAFTEQELKDLASTDGGSSVMVSTEGGYLFAKYQKYSRGVTICAKGAYALRASPMQITSTSVTKSELQNILDTLRTGAKEDYMTYNNRRYNFAFSAQVNSRLVESRVGDSAITFAPEGISLDPHNTEPKPLFTVRVGDPSTDPDCEASLEGWMVRMKQEFSKAPVDVSDLRFDTINSHRCVTFSEVQVQETMTGQEEHKAKIIVFVEEGKTYMLRWEVPKNAWNRFESKLYRLLDSFKFSC